MVLNSNNINEPPLVRTSIILTVFINTRSRWAKIVLCAYESVCTAHTIDWLLCPAGFVTRGTQHMIRHNISQHNLLQCYGAGIHTYTYTHTRGGRNWGRRANTKQFLNPKNSSIALLFKSSSARRFVPFTIYIPKCNSYHNYAYFLRVPCPMRSMILNVIYHDGPKIENTKKHRLWYPGMIKKRSVENTGLYVYTERGVKKTLDRRCPPHTLEVCVLI